MEGVPGTWNAAFKWHAQDLQKSALVASVGTSGNHVPLEHVPD